MEGSPLGSRRPDEQEFNLRDWHLRARISRETTNSRRYSASYIRSFREDSRSFRSNFTISSTTSSPGDHLKDEIDPSTYSFTTALKALQARSGYVWECMSPEGFALNSKWDEAERYICNPFSGEVPMECLSAKTLSGRSFRSYMAGRVTMSAPLVYFAHNRKPNNTTMTTTKPAASSVTVIEEKLVKPHFPVQEEKQMGSRTRDVGIQSTLSEKEDEVSSSPSAASTPSIQERSVRRCEDTEDGDTQNSSSSIKMKPPVDECVMQVQVKITREGEETKRSAKKEAVKKKKMMMMIKKKTGELCSGCLISSWRTLWSKKRHRDKHKLPPSSHNQTILEKEEKKDFD